MPARLSNVIVSEADDHATPRCPHFGPCGGCQLQDVPYAAQLELKAGQLQRLLTPRGLDGPAPTLHPSPPFAYRNRIRLTLGEIDDKLRAGYICNISSQPGIPEEDEAWNAATGSFLPITQCPIAAPILWRAAEAFLVLIGEYRNALLKGRHIPDQLELFTTADEAKLQLTLFLRTPVRFLPKELNTAFVAFCDALRARIPELSGAGIALLPPLSTERSRRAEATRPGPFWGSEGLKYSISTAHDQAADINYWVPRGAFFQANRYLLPELLSLVTANRTGALAWDLYAGVGLFSRVLARSFAHVAAVEAADPAAMALASTGLRNLRAIKAATLGFLRAAAVERDRPDLIVLDPPRSGAGPDVCELLARVAAPTLIYVSCSPQTLPADLRVLIASGYRVAELHLLDLFPQTTHIETVAVLTR